MQNSLNCAKTPPTQLSKRSEKIFCNLYLAKNSHGLKISPAAEIDMKISIW